MTSPPNSELSQRELNSKVAIVTGAGRMRGIGRGTANVLARMGANVVITGTGRDPATFPDDEKQAGWRDIQSTAEEVEARGVRALPLIVNVADEDDVQSRRQVVGQGLH